MCPEQQQPDERIVLPSELRILQRLGQVSSNASLRNNLFPKIAELEKETYTPEELVLELAERMIHYSEEHVLGITALTLNDMPTYINALVDDDEHKKQALDSWAELVESGKANAEAREQYKRYSEGKKSRKDKKRPESRPSKERELRRSFEKKPRKRR